MSNYAVVCRTCLRNVYEGDTSPDDGQTLLTAFADSVTGAACPSGVATCPNKTAAMTTARQQTVAAILARLAAIEAKVRP
jgi:hypothetical protein